MARSGMTRRKFMVGAFVCAAAGMAVGEEGVYDASVDSIVLEKVEVPLRNCPRELAGFTIAQLSDIHFHSEGPVLRAVEIANHAHPDVVVLTGDYVTNSYTRGEGAAKFADPCAKLLAGLRPKRAVYAVLGNHDYWAEPRVVHHALERVGFQVLYNRATRLDVNGAPLWLAGVGDVLNDDASLEKALSGVPVSETKVLLAHEPDLADASSQLGVDLQLSGHSHGGQVRLPLLGAPILPPLGRKYPEGLRRVGAMQEYTNRGIGTTGVPIRFNCPPEVTLLTLVPEKA